MTESQAPDESPAPPDTSEEHDTPLVPVSVDTNEVQEPRLQPGESVRNPVIPAWVRSRASIASAVKLHLGRMWHAVVYHLLRTPLYLLKLIARSPRGARRAVAAAVRSAGDAEMRRLQSAAVETGDAPEYMRLAEVRKTRARTRVLLSLWALLVVLLTLAVVTWLLGLKVTIPVLIIVVLITGAFGKPDDDRPLTRGSVVRHEVPRLTSKTITTALNATGVTGLKEGADIRFVAPITRDGPGYRADIDLPVGVTAAAVMEKRRELAAGLRRPIGAVWPEPDHQQHPGRLVLFVADRDMANTPPTRWPLAKRGKADLFGPLPLGADQRGSRIAVELMFNNVLIGAMPRYGKTFVVRLLLLAAALDVTVQLRVFEMKGTGDLSPLARVAHHYEYGPGDEEVEKVIKSLRELRKELNRRTKTIAKLPRSACPENKVTPQLAARKDLGLFPIVCAIDECQMVFTHEEFGKEAGEIATDIIKRGPAVGIVLILSTQRPDRDSLPTGISANVGLRICFRVMGHQENDMILGTGAHRNGIRATTFTGKDVGIAYLVGNTDDPQIVRPDYVDAGLADSIADRGRAARQAAGTLSGQALEEDDAPTNDLLDDVAAVIRPGETKLWSETVVSRLAQLRPDEYGNWKAEHLANGLKPRGVGTTQVWGRDHEGVERTRRGIIVRDLTEAITERDRGRV